MISIINPFYNNPYEIWSYRAATESEMLDYFQKHKRFQNQIKDSLIEKVNSPLEAAIYISKRRADNGLENHIDNFLEKSNEFKNWRNHMPSPTPKCFTNYQQAYPLSEEKLEEVNRCIWQIPNFTLPIGQILFHGGKWLEYGNKMLLERPLSTTFCPQVALRECEWNGKAYDNGEIGLWVITIKSNKIPAFIYRIKGTKMGNEKEVLLPKGIYLEIKNKSPIMMARVSKMNYTTQYEKDVPVYIYEIVAY